MFLSKSTDQWKKKQKTHFKVFLNAIKTADSERSHGAALWGHAGHLRTAFLRTACLTWPLLLPSSHMPLHLMTPDTLSTTESWCGLALTHNLLVLIGNGERRAGFLLQTFSFSSPVWWAELWEGARLGAGAGSYLSPTRPARVEHARLQQSWAGGGRWRYMELQIPLTPPSTRLQKQLLPLDHNLFLLWIKNLKAEVERHVFQMMMVLNENRMVCTSIQHTSPRLFCDSCYTSSRDIQSNQSQFLLLSSAPWSRGACPDSDVWKCEARMAFQSSPSYGWPWTFP